MMNELSRIRIAGDQRLLQCIQDHLSVWAGGYFQAHNVAREDINDERNIDKAGCCSDIGKLRNPKPVGRRGFECAVHLVFGACKAGLLFVVLTSPRVILHILLNFIKHTSLMPCASRSCQIFTAPYCFPLFFQKPIILSLRIRSRWWCLVAFSGSASIDFRR